MTYKRKVFISRVTSEFAVLLNNLKESHNRRAENILEVQDQRDDLLSPEGVMTKKTIEKLIYWISEADLVCLIIGSEAGCPTEIDTQNFDKIFLDLLDENIAKPAFKANIELYLTQLNKMGAKTISYTQFEGILAWALEKEVRVFLLPEKDNSNQLVYRQWTANYIDSLDSERFCGFSAVKAENNLLSSVRIFLLEWETRCLSRFLQQNPLDLLFYWIKSLEDPFLTNKERRKKLSTLLWENFDKEIDWIESESFSILGVEKVFTDGDHRHWLIVCNDKVVFCRKVNNAWNQIQDASLRDIDEVIACNFFESDAYILLKRESEYYLHQVSNGDLVIANFRISTLAPIELFVDNNTILIELNGEQYFYNRNNLNELVNKTVHVEKNEIRECYKDITPELTVHLKREFRNSIILASSLKTDSNEPRWVLLKKENRVIMLNLKIGILSDLFLWKTYRFKGNWREVRRDEHGDLVVGSQSEGIKVLEWMHRKGSYELVSETGTKFKILKNKEEPEVKVGKMSVSKSKNTEFCLWAIPNQVTHELMKEFVTCVTGTNASPRPLKPIEIKQMKTPKVLSDQHPWWSKMNTGMIS